MMSQTDVKEIGDKAVLDVAVDAGRRRREARRHGQRHGIAVRGRALRLEQHDHAALPPEGSEGAGGGEGVQAGRRHLPGRLVHRQRRRGAGAAGGRSARADRGRRCASAPQVPMHDLDLPRVAVYSTWGSTQDVGWVRFAFDKFELPYDLIYKDRVREGNLQGRVRRHRHPAPGGQRQAAGVRHRLARDADRVQEERAVQVPRDVRRVGRHHRRAWGSKASPSSTSSRRRAACS